MTDIEEFNDLKVLGRKLRRRSLLIIGALSVLAVLSFIVCIFIGSVDLDFWTVLDAFQKKASWSQNEIVNNIRVPRLICAAIVGASLSVGGMAMQAMFKNPMASPSVLGISSGASFGAAFYIAFGYGVLHMPYGTTIFAFIMATLTMVLVYSFSYQKGRVQTIMLLLAGMAVSAMFSGLTSAVQFFSDADTVTSIVFWILGSFEKCNWSSVGMILLPAVVGILLISFNARELNLITAGENKARALGANVKMVRIMILIGSSLLVASSVAVCGVISFVGLIIPHIFRTLGGPNHKYLIPMCIIGGALFMMVIDTLARSIMPPYEFPVGIITALIGAPFFMYIMRSRKKEMWGV